MELHRAIRELVRAHGPGIMANPTGFRAGLDNLLGGDRSAATQLNLLEDAIRHQAVAPMLRILDSGGEPVAAVRDAGQHLARVRGGDDPAMCSWACAALGYGLGRVDDATMSRFSNGTTGVSALPPRVFPPVFFPPPAEQPPRRRRRGRLAVVLCTVLLMAVVGGGLAWWSLRPDPGKNSATSLDPEDEEIVLAEVDGRYSGLAAQITAAVSSCEAAEPKEGVEEELECEADFGTVTLTTYAGAAELEAGRANTMDMRVGTVSDVSGGNAYYSFDQENGSSYSPAQIYWDSVTSAQSVLATGDSTSPFAEVESWVERTRPTVLAPTEPTTPRLLDFIDSYGLNDCERVATYAPGEIEEDRCSRDGYTTYVGVFEESGAFLAYRWENEDLAKESDTYTGSDTVCRGDVNPDGTCKATLGKIYGYVSDEGTADETGVLYLDWKPCRCFVQVYGFEGRGRGDPDALLNVLYPDG